MRNRVNYLKIMVIVHGKSELILARYIKSNLKIMMEIIANNKGSNSIQVTSVMKTLKNIVFKNFNEFTKNYPEIQIINNKLVDFRLFIIMDVDDCTEKEKADFISGKMFDKHWLKYYITPIYNIKNLEDVMKKCKIKVENKKNYISIFPVNRGQKDLEQIMEFNSTLEKHKNYSNLSEFISYCIKVATE